LLMVSRRFFTVFLGLLQLVKKKSSSTDSLSSFIIWLSPPEEDRFFFSTIPSSVPKPIHSSAMYLSPMRVSLIRGTYVIDPFSHFFFPLAVDPTFFFRSHSQDFPFYVLFLANPPLFLVFDPFFFRSHVESQSFFLRVSISVPHRRRLHSSVG